MFVNTAQFFGPVMQVHSQIMKCLDPSDFRIFVATNSRGDTSSRLRAFQHVALHEYNLGATFRGSGLLGKALRVVQAPMVFLSFARIARLIRREQIGIIHAASQPRALLLSTLLSLATGAKLVLHVHERHRSSRSMAKWITGLCFRRARAVITVSRHMTGNVSELGVDKDRIWPIHNVVDLDRFRPGLDGTDTRKEYGIPPTAPLVVVIGRVMAEKGQQDLLEALPRVREVFSEVRALIVGWSSTAKLRDGRSYRQHLEARSSELGLQERVIFARPRPDIENVYAAADVVVVPSAYEEPFGLVVVEAMAMGKAVIATRSGGIPEVVEDGLTGILVARQAPAELAHEIVRVLSDENLRNALGTNARAAAEESFYESRLAAQVRAVYQQITA